MLQITALAVNVADNEWGLDRPSRKFLPFVREFHMFVWPSIALKRRVHTWDAALAHHTVAVPA